MLEVSIWASIYEFDNDNVDDNGKIAKIKKNSFFMIDQNQSDDIQMKALWKTKRLVYHNKGLDEK